MPSVAVAGSGQTGLICAAELARKGIEVPIVQRLPDFGGQEPEPDIAPISSGVREPAFTANFGTTAVRYADRQAQTLGVEGAATVRADALFVATGTGTRRVASCASPVLAIPT